MNASTTFALFTAFFITAFFFFFATRLGRNLSVRHVQWIFLQSTTSFGHGTTTKGSNQLSEWIWFAFFLLVFFLLLFGIFKRLLNKKKIENHS